MSDMGLPLAGIVYCDYLIIDFNGSLVWLEQSHNDIEQGAFTAAGKTYEANTTALFNCKIKVLEYPWRLGRIAK